MSISLSLHCQIWVCLIERTQNAELTGCTVFFVKNNKSKKCYSETVTNCNGLNYRGFVDS